MGTNKGNVSPGLACLLHPCIALLSRFNTRVAFILISDTWSVPVSLVLILSPKISESVNPFQGCAIEAVGVMKPFTFSSYSHDFAFGLVKIKLP